ncbi:oligoendopeptidase F [Candidatus Nanohalobium constans]|uniref:Oligoendopeptidase F n=1 Tax=Candidatus Nanohalobium constans TaxID=2565781 RepID=A0A5Q0UEE8_9ARCH|nr:oligoendopeptidase F [Candidatus Nanohalobium constans]QGA79943.1 oligoendopeptidase F [Candidatus Nanohalobium constans]
MVKERNEIEERYKWDIKSMFSSIEEAEREAEELKEEASKLEEYEGKVTSSAKNLAAVLELKFDISRRMMHLSRFASMLKDQDTRNQDAQRLVANMNALSTDISNKTGFIRPEIAEAGKQKIEQFIEEEESLERFEHYFEDLFRMEEHILDADKESMLAGLGDVLDSPHETYSTFTNADLTFPKVEKPSGEEVELTTSNFTKFQQNPDRDFRKETYEKMYDTFGNYRNTITTTLQKNIRKNVRMAEIRGFDSARESAMKPDNIPGEVYDNLVETVRDNLDLLHRHAELKKKVLGLEELTPYDLYMPVTETESPEISFEEAKDHVLEALQPLGKDYVEKVREALGDERWVDVYENKGKRSGAYSGGSYDSRPFTLMNYQNDMSSMYTLIHELGHSMHSHHTNSSQPYHYSDYTIFQAEVASTTNEALLTRHLLDTVEDEEFRKHVLSHALENFRSTLFRQTMFSEFEHWLHRELEKGDAITPDKADQKYGELKSRYYSNLELDDRIKKEWMRIPHFYYNYYVYQYATGISAGNTLAEKIVDEGPEDYLNFLRTGSSEYSIESLRKAGADMSSPEPIEKALGKYEEYLERAERLNS